MDRLGRRCAGGVTPLQRLAAAGAGDHNFWVIPALRLLYCIRLGLAPA